MFGEDVMGFSVRKQGDFQTKAQKNFEMLILRQRKSSCGNGKETGGREGERER